MASSKLPKRFAPSDLDDSNIAAGAAIALSKIAGSPIRADGTVAFTGSPDAGNNRVVNVATPSGSNDAANKAYVDTQISSVTGLFTAKGTVRVATTGNITLSGAQTIDGISVVAGDRVLVKNQTTTSQNGLYVAASGSWTRALDMDVWGEVPGAWVTVQQGTVNADTIWLSTADQGGTLETTAITWTNPITAGGLTTANFVFDETPSGSVNGSNTSFTLANTPISGTVRLHLNGYRLLPGSGNDYTISGATITMLTAPLTGEVLRADYLK